MKKILLSLYFFSHLSASQLQIYDEKTRSLLQKSSEPQEIAAHLKAIGVQFEQWETRSFSEAITLEEILKSYQMEMERIQQEHGFQSTDIVSISSNHPQKKLLRQKFLNEHTHDEPEVRFFIEGSGLFFLHIDSLVYSVLCEKGDLIHIPPNYRHWFDMGEEPLFTAIRFFTRPDGWIAYFTGNPIAEFFMD